MHSVAYEIACCQATLKLPVSSLWPGRHHKHWGPSYFVPISLSWNSVGVNIHISDSSEVSIHTAHRKSDYRHLQVFVYPTLNQWEYVWTSSNKNQKTIWIPSDFVQETKSFDSKINTEKQRSEPQLPSLNLFWTIMLTHTWLLLQELTQRSGWIILCTTLSLCTEEYLEPEMRP